jgi:hypothetical protein
VNSKPRLSPLRSSSPKNLTGQAGKRKEPKVRRLEEQKVRRLGNRIKGKGLRLKKIEYNNA